MTLDDVVRRVQEVTARDEAVAETPMTDLGLDSLEYVELFATEPFCDIPDDKVVNIHTVEDLFTALQKVQ